MYSNDIKILALKLYNKLCSLRKVASILEISPSTISRWKNFKKQDRKKIQKILDPPDISDSIKLFILTHPFCSLKDIQKMLEKSFTVKVSLELIRLFIVKNKD